jgi:hypothetical protein
LLTQDECRAEAGQKGKRHKAQGKRLPRFSFAIPFAFCLLPFAFYPAQAEYHDRAGGPEWFRVALFFDKRGWPGSAWQ